MLTPKMANIPTVVAEYWNYKNKFTSEEFAFGENLPKIKRIRRKYDPKGIFSLPERHNQGSKLQNYCIPRYWCGKDGVLAENSLNGVPKEGCQCASGIPLNVDPACEDAGRRTPNSRFKIKSVTIGNIDDIDGLCDCEAQCRAQGGFASAFKERKFKQNKPSRCLCYMDLPSRKDPPVKREARGFTLLEFGAIGPQ